MLSYNAFGFVGSSCLLSEPLVASAACHTGYHMAAAQPQRQQAQCPEQPRRRLLGRRKRALHPRWVCWERRGGLGEWASSGERRLRGFSAENLDDLWFFSREARRVDREASLVAIRFL